jgi:hypothetical protein
MQYQRKVTAPQQSEMRHDTVQSKIETAGTKKPYLLGRRMYVTFGDPCAEEEKKSGKHAPITGEVPPAAKNSTPTQKPRVSPEDTKQSDTLPP